MKKYTNMTKTLICLSFIDGDSVYLKSGASIESALIANLIPKGILVEEIKIRKLKVGD